jgi:hypothetical protein
MPWLFAHVMLAIAYVRDKDKACALDLPMAAQGISREYSVPAGDRALATDIQGSSSPHP